MTSPASAPRPHRRVLRCPRWLRRPRWDMWLRWAVAAVLVAVYVVQYVDDRAEQASRDRTLKSTIDCVEAWADAYSARAEFVNRYLLPKNAADDALQAARYEHAPAAEVAKLQHTYLAALAAYNAATKANPPLPAPRFLCAERDGQPPPSLPSGLPTNIPPPPTTGAGSSGAGASTPTTAPATSPTTGPGRSNTPGTGTGPGTSAVVAPGGGTTTRTVTTGPGPTTQPGASSSPPTAVTTSPLIPILGPLLCAILLPCTEASS